MIEFFYLGIGITFGLWASKKVYRAVLKDSTSTLRPNPEAFDIGFACFAGTACVFICTLLWPLIMLALVLRRFLWNSTSSTSTTPRS